jgi:2-polyprenyl-3-methyl-5-hydroxy-6-metoxy-1,4-benzoquinol methylase
LHTVADNPRSTIQLKFERKTAMKAVSTSPTLMSEIQQRLRFVNRERWFRLVVRGKNNSVAHGFFDRYPRFFSTSTTASQRDRLNQRHRALIESNGDVIAGRRILDMASHDGRWTLAAHKAGAKHVLGIEARSHLIEAAHSNMSEYGVPGDQVEFRQGDVLAELDRLESGSFDTVFCFGFLYHTIDHMPLFRKIARLRPTNLVIDTAISIRPANIIEIRDEQIDEESAGAVGEPGSPARTVIGKPTKSALELMLKAAGFQPLRYYDWFKAGIRRWDDLPDYYLGARVSLTAVARAENHR